MRDENPVPGPVARKLLGSEGVPMSQTRYSAVKKCMGLSGNRYVFVSDIRRWLRDNPQFREVDAYPRS